jgi:hypothetical protein
MKKKMCPWCYQIYDSDQITECVDEIGEIVSVCEYCYDEREEVEAEKT